MLNVRCRTCEVICLLQRQGSMQVLHGQFKEGARAFRDYFGQVLEEKGYEAPWLKGEWISPDRQPVRTNAARIDCLLLTKAFPKLVSPFGNAVACLEEWMPFQLRTFQADEHIFEAVLTAEQRASKERARVFSAMGREYLSKNPAEQKMLASCMAFSVEQTSYCTRYCDLTSEHYNKYYCLEKLKSCWFASKKAEIGTVLGCLGVVNECLARAEVETMASPVLKERATAGDKLIAASFPLLGELALALHPSPPLHGKLFVFLRKSTLMDLLPLLARHLERALTGYFETTSIDLNPAVRCLCTVNVGRSSITVLFRDEKGENLLATVEILFSHPEVIRTLMSRTEESSAGNGLLLLRGYFILKNVLSKPALWFATLLAVDVWHHGAQLAPNYKLSEHLSIWELVVLSWILDEKSSDNVGTVFVRLMSTIELFSTPLPSPLYGSSSSTMDSCFDPFRFESSATKEKKAPTTKLSGFVNALCGKQCGKFMGFDLTDAQKELYRRAQPVIRNYLIKGLKEDVASRQAMTVEKPRPFPVALPVAVMASPLPSTLTMTPPATPTVTSPIATRAAAPVATVPSTVQPDVKPAIFPVSPEKPVTLPGLSFSVQSPPLPPEIKVEPVESQQQPPAPERTGPLLPPPITVTTCPSPTPPRDPRCRPRYQGIPASYQQQCEQALKEQDFVRALLLKQQGLLARESVDYPAKSSPDFPAPTSAAVVSLSAQQSLHAHLSSVKAGQNLLDRPHQTGQAAEVDEPRSENSTSISRKRPSLGSSERRAERRKKQASFGQSSRKRRHSDDSNSDDDQRRLVIDHGFSSPNSKEQEEGELEERCSSQRAEAQRELHNPVDGQDSVYVGEIRDGTGHARIKQLFLRYGPRRVYVRKSSYHTNSEFAHITFGSARAAAAAYAELQNEEMDKRRLFLSLSTKKNELLTDANHMGRFDVMLKGLPARYIRAEIIAKLERKLSKQLDDIFLRGPFCYLSFIRREDAEKFLERRTIQWGNLRCDVVVAPNARRNLRQQ